jgi:hypothetical protein
VTATTDQHSTKTSRIRRFVRITHTNANGNNKRKCTKKSIWVRKRVINLSIKPLTDTE